MDPKFLYEFGNTLQASGLISNQLLGDTNPPDSEALQGHQAREDWKNSLAGGGLFSLLR